MEFKITTRADFEMGNDAITVEAKTPEAAAEKLKILACDYFCENAELHVGESEIIIVEDSEGNVTHIETEYK